MLVPGLAQLQLAAARAWAGLPDLVPVGPGDRASSAGEASLGWAFLAFAFVTHAASTLDVLRQRSFPVFPPVRRCRLDASAGSGSSAYLPLGTILTLYALPAQPDGPAGDRLPGESPGIPGSRILRPASGSGCGCRRTRRPRAGRVVAVGRPGGRVDGRDAGGSTARRSTHSPRSSPPSTTPSAGSSASPSITSWSASRIDSAQDRSLRPMVLVSQDQIVGRVWARYYPVLGSPPALTWPRRVRSRLRLPRRLTVRTTADCGNHRCRTAPEKTGMQSGQQVRSVLC